MRPNRPIDARRDHMEPSGTTFLVMDLTGTFAFALNGAWTAMRAARLVIVGVLTTTRPPGQAEVTPG